MGPTRIGVNLPRVREFLREDAPIGSRELVFNPKYMEELSEFGVHFLDAPTEIIPSALKYIGENLIAQDTKGCDRNVNENQVRYFKAIVPLRLLTLKVVANLVALAKGSECPPVGNGQLLLDSTCLGLRRRLCS